MLEIAYNTTTSDQNLFASSPSRERHTYTEIPRKKDEFLPARTTYGASSCTTAESSLDKLYGVKEPLVSCGVRTAVWLPGKWFVSNMHEIGSHYESTKWAVVVAASCASLLVRMSVGSAKPQPAVASFSLVDIAALPSSNSFFIKLVTCVVCVSS